MMQLQVGVKILLKNPDGKYLLARRNQEKYPEMSKTPVIGGFRLENIAVTPVAITMLRRGLTNSYFRLAPVINI